jgi:hypothetical protein
MYEPVAENRYQNHTPAAPRSDGVSVGRLIVLAFGIVQLIMSRKVRAGFLVTLAGGVVLGALGVLALVRSRRRPRTWTERLAERLGIDFDAREAEATIHRLGREVDRLRHEVEARFEEQARQARQTAERASDILHRS